MANDKKKREAKHIPRVAAFIYDTLSDQQPDVEITPDLPSDYTDDEYHEFFAAPFDEGDGEVH